MDTAFPQAFDQLAYYGRVSTPHQKLEHQRESVLRFRDAHGLNIPSDRMFEDRARRHKAATEGEAMQQLMRLVERNAIDWIIIATFDRWGIEDPNDIFILRKMLSEHDVQLWSVADQLNVTGADDGDFFRVASNAVAATRYVSQMAEKNIQKMIWMAEQGWATTGNAPFGTDLVLHQLTDITQPLLRVIRLRFRPHLFKIIWYAKDGHTVEKEEVSEHMPPRDKKTTGYRYAHSDEEDRLKAVNLMFELYDQGMGFAEISENLWKQGFRHYDKPFGYHGVEVILSNSAYIGLPAWGKVGVGQYRHAINKQAQKPKRKSTDPITVKKTEDQYIYPIKPVFKSIVPEDLFNRVKAKLKERIHVNPSFGKRRTRNRANHPLNGKLVCPDCKKPMVLGSFMPTSGQKHRCFQCGTWRKTIRTQCHPNTVRWDLLDKATDALLQKVADRIEKVTTGDLNILQQEEWPLKTELGQLIFGIVGLKQIGENAYAGPVLPRGFDRKDPQVGRLTPDEMGYYFEEIFSEYDRTFQQNNAALRAELDQINVKLENIATQIEQGIPSATVRNRLNQRMAELETRKAELEPKLTPLTSKAKAIIDQLVALKDTIERADTAKRAALLDSFIEEVHPIFEVRQGKKRKAYVTGFKFIPRETAKKIMPEELEIGTIRRGTGSSPQPG